MKLFVSNYLNREGEFILMKFKDSIFIITIILLINSFCLAQNIEDIDKIVTANTKFNEIAEKKYNNEDFSTFTETKEFSYDDFVKILVDKIQINGDKLLKKHYAHFIFMIDRSKSIHSVTYTKWRTELFGRLLENFLIEKGELSQKSDKLSIVPFRLNSEISLYGADYKCKDPYKDLYIPKGCEEGEGTDYITSLIEMLTKLEKDGSYDKENIIIILLTDEQMDNASPLQDKLVEFNNKHLLNYYCEHYEMKLTKGKEEKRQHFTISIYYNSFPDRTQILPDRYEIIMKQGGKLPGEIATQIPTITPTLTVTSTPTPTLTPTITPTVEPTPTPAPTPEPKPLIDKNNAFCIPLSILFGILFISGVYLWLLRDKISYGIKTDKGEEATLTFKRKRMHTLQNPHVGQLRLDESVFLIKHEIGFYPEKDYIIRDSSGKDAERSGRRRKGRSDSKDNGVLLEKHILKISDRGTPRENKFTYRKKDEPVAWNEITITVFPKKKEKKSKKDSRKSGKKTENKKDNN